MTDVLLRCLHHRLWRSIIVAVPIATMVTWGTHSRVARKGPQCRLEYGGTLYLNRVLGLPADHIMPDFDALAEGRSSECPFLRRYCETVADRARCYLRPEDASIRCDVWTLTRAYLEACGWPWASAIEAGKVIVDESRPDHTGDQHVFWADETGSSPIRYGGLLANWFVYFGVSLLVAWPLDIAVCAIIRRRRRACRGFPVVPVERQNGN